jgi:predicted RecA/RadA family phage recombinase
MKNMYQRPATELSLPVVAGTKSGDPVRVGNINGVAATNIGEGGNAATHASVDTRPNGYLYEVAGAIANAGQPVYFTARAGATAPILSTTVSGAIWGYVYPKAGESGVRAATSGVAVVRPAQV